MSVNKKAPPKTGVNKGIQKGVREEKFDDKVICKKCGKEITFTLGSKLFIKCPRCAGRVERCLKEENKRANKIIKWDILRRSKKAQLIIGLFFVILGTGFNALNFFVQFWTGNLQYIGFATLPLILFGGFCIMWTRKTSASKKYKFYAWLAGWIVLAAIVVVVATSVPYLAENVRDWLGITTK